MSVDDVLVAPTSVSPSPAAPRHWVRLFGIALGYFMVLLDMTVLAVAEPDLARSLQPSTAGLQWAVTAYTVTFAAALLSAGAATDRFGAERVFTVGVVAFGLGSLGCAAAPDLATLVALRAALGVAAAACVPASMAMLAALYPDARRRARAVSVWAAVSGAAVAAGPVLGGVLVALGGWRAVFLANVPLAALTCALARGPRAARHREAVPAPRLRGRRRTAWAMQAAAVAAPALGTDAVIALGARDVAHGVASLAGTTVAVVALARLDRRAPSPLLVRGPGLAPALFTGACVNAALAGVLFVVPLVLARQTALSPLQTGLAFLPMTVPFAVNPLLTGRLVARRGPWPPLLLGVALLVVGGLALAAAVHGDAPGRTRGFVVLLVALAALGFGTSFALPSLVALVIGVAPPGAAGRASGLFSAVRQLGASVGVALAGAFVADAPATGLVALAGLCAAALVLLLVAARRPRKAG